jgi:hypothetical protein
LHNEFSYKRFKGWGAMITGLFEDFGGQGIFPEIKLFGAKAWQ